MKDIIKKLVYHIDPELKPKEEDPVQDQEKKKCDGIVGHTLAKIQGKQHGCEELAQANQEEAKDEQLIDLE